MSVAIIINPIAGGARPAVARARAQLALTVVDQHGDPAEVFVTEGVGHARDLAKAAVGRGARLVMAWGGDGTINEVASALAFDEIPLGIIPAGSGNGLARELGVHPRPERAIADALAAEPRPMDLGEIEGRLFANTAGVGFDAHIASRFAASRRRGFLGYAGITARALADYVPLTYRITTQSGTVDVRAVLVTIANSAQFGNGALHRARSQSRRRACWISWWWRSDPDSRRCVRCRGCSTARWAGFAAARFGRSSASPSRRTGQ